MTRNELQVREHSGLSYALRLPTDATQKSRHPILFFLHGYDEGAPTEISRALTRHGPLRRGNPLDALAPFIVVAPQLPFRGDVWAHFHQQVLSLLRHVNEEFCGDAQRSYLTGFSFGANGVLELGMVMRQTWAALWAVDPTRVPRRAPEAPLWLSFGEIARSRKPQFIRALDLSHVTDPPTGDRLQLDEGADHVGSATLSYSDARIYRWLLSHMLKA